MKVVVAEGTSQAAYVIDSFREHGHELVEVLRAAAEEFLGFCDNLLEHVVALDIGKSGFDELHVARAVHGHDSGLHGEDSGLNRDVE